MAHIRDKPFILQGLGWRAWITIETYSSYEEAMAHLTQIKVHGVARNTKEWKCHTFRIVEVRAVL